MKSTKLIAIFTASALVLTTVPAAHADVIAPGRKGVDNHTFVDLGIMTGQCILPYTVGEGENLRTIAEKQLGDVSRLGEIEKLNKVSSGSALIAGQVIYLPPKEAGAPGYWPLLRLNNIGRSQLVDLVPGKKIPWCKLSAEVFLVPNDQLMKFREAATNGDEDYPGVLGLAGLETLREKFKTVLWGGPIMRTYTVDQGSSVDQIFQTYRVIAVEGNQITLSETARLLDKDGEEISQLNPTTQLYVAGLGALGIVLLLRRRREGRTD